MDKKSVPIPYFMTHSLLKEDRNIEDKDYFRQLYPDGIKRYLRIVEDVLNRIDEKESYIYDEFPDKIRMERLTEIILRMIPLENNMDRRTQRNMVKVLLFDEIIERRKINKEKIL